MAGDPLTFIRISPMPPRMNWDWDKLSEQKRRQGSSPPDPVHMGEDWGKRLSSMLAFGLGQFILFLGEFGLNQPLVTALNRRYGRPGDVLFQYTLIKAVLFLVGVMACCTG